MRKLSWKMINAVIDNDVAAIERLLKARQNVNAKNESGETED